MSETATFTQNELKILGLTNKQLVALITPYAGDPDPETDRALAHTAMELIDPDCFGNAATDAGLGLVYNVQDTTGGTDIGAVDDGCSVFVYDSGVIVDPDDYAVAYTDPMTITFTASATRTLTVTACGLMFGLLSWDPQHEVTRSQTEFMAPGTDQAIFVVDNRTGVTRGFSLEMATDLFTTSRYRRFAGIHQLWGYLKLGYVPATPPRISIEDIDNHVAVRIKLFDHSSVSGKVMSVEEDFFGCRIGALPIFLKVPSGQDELLATTLTGTYLVHEAEQTLNA